MNDAFLVGKKTYLRPVELADTKLIQKWHNDPKIRKMARLGELPVTYTKEEGDIRVAKDSKEEIYLIVVKKSTNKPIGFVRLNFIDTVSRNMWLRFVVGDPKVWGKNFAHDALNHVLGWLFSELNIHRVTLETYATNTRAIRFFQKLGFKQEGVVRDAVYFDGKYYDIISLGILASEFKKKTSTSNQ
jgi:RimJ/RimL family protein N-acetyltransferase